MTMDGKLAYSIGFFCLIAGIATTPEPKKIGKLIIDTDSTGDDAIAILMALAAEKQVKGEGLQVIGITCTYGNTRLTNVATNVLKLLTIAKREDIPVYLGAERPLTKEFKEKTYFGNDGFGDFEFDQAILGLVDTTKHASIAMIEFARKYPGEVSVMAIGPTTNVALAMSLDPNFANNVRKFYLAGSTFDTTWNSTGVYRRDNFWMDPPSNFIVMNWARGGSSDLLPWDSVLNSPITTKWRKDVLGSINSTTMKYLNKIEGPTFNDAFWRPADAIRSALVFWEMYIAETYINANLFAVHDGPGAGYLVPDYAANGYTAGHDTRIVKSINVEEFKKLLLQIFAIN